MVAPNNVVNLHRYIENHGPRVFGPVEVYYWNPFYVAAENGSTGAFREFLEFYWSDSRAGFSTL